MKRYRNGNALTYHGALTPGPLSTAFLEAQEGGDKRKKQREEEGRRGGGEEGWRERGRGREHEAHFLHPANRQQEWTVKNKGAAGIHMVVNSHLQAYGGDQAADRGKWTGGQRPLLIRGLFLGPLFLLGWCPLLHFPGCFCWLPLHTEQP